MIEKNVKFHMQIGAKFEGVSGELCLGRLQPATPSSH